MFNSSVNVELTLLCILSVYKKHKFQWFYSKIPLCGSSCLWLFVSVLYWEALVIFVNEHCHTSCLNEAKVCLWRIKITETITVLFASTFLVQFGHGDLQRFAIHVVWILKYHYEYDWAMLTGLQNFSRQLFCLRTIRQDRLHATVIVTEIWAKLVLHFVG